MRTFACCKAIGPTRSGAAILRWSVSALRGRCWGGTRPIPSTPGKPARHLAQGAQRRARTVRARGAPIGRCRRLRRSAWRSSAAGATKRSAAAAISARSRVVKPRIVERHRLHFTSRVRQEMAQRTQSSGKIFARRRSPTPSCHRAARQPPRRIHRASFWHFSGTLPRCSARKENT